MSLLSTRIFIIHLILSRESRDKKKNQNFNFKKNESSLVLKFPLEIPASISENFQCQFKKKRKSLLYTNEK
jgi:hypothetical protein